ncbi:putative F-box/LRR-repeat protein 23, partial [Tanacetum coccineum]
GFNTPLLNHYLAIKAKLSFEHYYAQYNVLPIAIGKTVHELRHLELIGSNMTNAANFGLQVILDGCRHLETLDLRECFYIDLNRNSVTGCLKQINHLKLPTDSLEISPYVCARHDTEYEEYLDNLNSTLYDGYISQ